MVDLIAELEGVVRLSEAVSFSDLDWGWRRDDGDTPGSIFSRSFGGAHQAVAMCPRYGKKNFEADAAYIIAAVNFLRTHHAEIAAAVRDGARWKFLCTADPDRTDDVVDLIMACVDKPDLDAAMDTAMRAGEGEG